MAEAAGPAEWKETAKDLFSGTVAGLFSKALEYPFDSVKVRQQNAPGNIGVFECASGMYRNEGAVSFFRGLPAPMVGAMAENALVFGLYAKARRLIAGTGDPAQLERMPVWHTLAAGAISGFGVAFWLTPVELVKVRLQTKQTAHLYRGTLHCAAEMVRTGGLPGLFRGHTATLIRETAGGAMYFGGYIAACNALVPAGKTKADLHPAATMFAGGCGGAAYWLATFPADTVKSRVQGGQLPSERSFAGNLAHVYRGEGLRALYRGLGITLSRAMPSNALIFYVYETVMRLLKDV